MANYTFSNNKTLVNCTPHPIRFQDLTGEVITIGNDPEYLINARVEEETVEEDGVIFSRPTFVPTPEGAAIIDRIRQEFPDGCVIIGSIIAAQASPAHAWLSGG